MEAIPAGRLAKAERTSMRKILMAMGGTERGWSRHNDEGTFRDYEAEVQRLFKSAKDWNDIECVYLNNEFITSQPYYESHRDVLDKTSFGFTMKAIGFYETFKFMEEGDIAFFVDSNHIVAKDPTVFYDYANDNDVFIHDHIWVQYKNKHWTRRDTFINMGCDSERYWESLQMQCNIIGLKKTPKVQDFVTEYFNDALTYKIMFGENRYPNFDGFREHRHDQSIFSILTEKYEFPYINRTQNVWAEYVIPEIDTITPENPVDNSYRKEQDRLDIR
jgi:hypothetical protein